MLKKFLIGEHEVEVKLERGVGGLHLLSYGECKAQVEVIRSAGAEHLFVIDGRRYRAVTSTDAEGTVWVHLGDRNFRFVHRSADFLGEEAGGGGNSVSAPFPGKVIKVLVKIGDRVKKGDPMIIVEAMKLETILEAPRDGVVADVSASESQQIGANVPLITLAEEAKA